jgi:hypothetical protein
MLLTAASVVVWLKHLPTLASRNQRREGAEESSFWKQAKGQYLLTKDLITAGAHHLLRKQQAVITDSMPTTEGDDGAPLWGTCSVLTACRELRA